jgi:hypothetical protein
LLHLRKALTTAPINCGQAGTRWQAVLADTGSRRIAVVRKQHPPLEVLAHQAQPAALDYAWRLNRRRSVQAAGITAAKMTMHQLISEMGSNWNSAGSRTFTTKY